MTWGIGPWGAGSPWGTGTALAPPTLIGVSSSPGPTASSSGPAVVDENGGTICTLIGTNFADPTTIDILVGGPGSYVVVAQGYIFDVRYDLRANRIVFGAPALERGLYHVRATTGGGPTSVLSNVIAARRFAEEHKTLSVRGKFSSTWETGPRILRG